uniref:FYVE-type domain-containing protein n=1 Tax=Globodera pallida TaxID=36090 RepID=A0A183BRD0_GLOPA
MQSSSFVYNDHWDYFIKERNEAVAKISDPTNNLIIRLDKLINDFQQQNSEWSSRKEFEKHVVPWSESKRDNCELCKIRFTITRRRHHCRLCGAQLCGSCSQFLSIKSAQRLTGLDSSLVSSFLLAITNGDANHCGNGSMFGNLSLSLDKPMGHGFAVDRTLQNLGNSFAMMKNKLGSVVSRSISGDGVHVGETNAADGTAAYSLRICSKCKKLLDRRERAMELRWENANDSLVDAYQKLCNLLSQISHLASSYKNMAESLNNGETLYSLSSATSVRLKLKDLQEEIIRLSNLIEDWGSSRGDAPATETAPVLLPSCRQLQLQKNIKLLALHTLHDVVNVGPDLPSVEQYEQKKRSNQQRMMRRRRVGAESAGSYPRRNGRPAGGGEREERPMRQSSSFTGGGRSSSEESWMPFGNPIADKKQNPFLEGLEELHPIQEQYLISKSFLEQATLAGRLDEVKILERNLRELEHELDVLNLHKPNEL